MFLKLPSSSAANHAAPRSLRMCVIPNLPVANQTTTVHCAPAGPYHLLDPTDFKAQLGNDFEWATGSDGGIPLFDASDAMLRQV